MPSFGILKDALLQRKRCPFAVQKDTFYIFISPGLSLYVAETVMPGRLSGLPCSLCGR